MSGSNGTNGSSPRRNGRVFISYSRKDKTFVQTLHKGLVANQIEAWVDWEGIPLSADWWEEIEKAIHQADTFIYIISPDSLKSQVCGKEVDEAVSTHKRFVPILYREPQNGDPMHEKVSATNWVYMRPQDNYTAALPQLVETINTDLDWVQKHTRLVRRADEWDDHGRSSSYTLRGEDLNKAESWLAEASDKEPSPTSLQIEYIQASRQEAAKRQRMLLIGVSSALVLTVLLAIAAIFQFFQANRNYRIAFSHELTGEALAEVETFPQRALLLAVEAVKFTGDEPDQTAEDTIRTVLARTGGIVSRVHETNINTLALSSDDHWLLTGDGDGRVYLWDLTAVAVAESGRPLPGHTASIKKVLFSPDNRWAATTSNDTTAILWDTTSADPAKNRVLLDYHSDGVTDIAFSTDGRWAATSGKDGLVVLWDLWSGLPAPELYPLSGHNAPVLFVDVSPDGRWLVSGDQAGEVRIWDLASDGFPSIFVDKEKHSTEISAVEFSPDGRQFATADVVGTLYLWEAAAPDFPAVQLNGHQEYINNLDFSGNGRWLASSSDDNSAILWDLASGDPANNNIIFDEHTDQVWYTQFSHDDHTLATASRDRVVRLWDLQKPEPNEDPIVLSGHDAPVYRLALSNTGKWLLSTGGDQTIRFWEMQDLQKSAGIHTFYGHEGEILGASLAASESWLATAAKDGTVKIWPLANSGENTITLADHKSRVQDVATSHDGRWLISGSADRTALLYDLTAPQIADSMQLLGSFDSPVNTNGVAISPNNRWAVVTDEGGWLHSWDLQAAVPAETKRSIPAHADKITNVMFSADGRWLATASRDETVRLWQMNDAGIADGVPYTLKGHSGSVWVLSFSPDGRWLASGSSDMNVNLWDLQNPEAPPRVFAGHEGEILALAFSPDGRWLVSGGSDSIAHLWTVDADQTLSDIDPIKGHESEITAVAFSADGRWLATGSSDKDVRLWDMSRAEPGEYSILLPGHTASITYIHFLSDNLRLITASQDGTSRLWTPLSLDQVVQNACQVAGRNLTEEEWLVFMGDNNHEKTCGALP